ncbi:phage terminase small subunit-related protein [Lacrimispora sp. AGF001]|uniref:phage terminase small subunit-related protein n=1 Tax=Lacrimispora sp. AGF001 TaxID=3401631 RepID=UPI003B42EB20
MARAPDERIKQAKALYLKGMKLVKIASQLNLPEGTVRRWKSTHKWDNERSDKNSERSHRKGQPIEIRMPSVMMVEPQKRIRIRLKRESSKLSFLMPWRKMRRSL